MTPQRRETLDALARMTRALRKDWVSASLVREMLNRDTTKQTWWEHLRALEDIGWVEVDRSGERNRVRMTTEGRRTMEASAAPPE